MKKLLIIIVSLIAVAAHASDIYFAQAAQGSNNGTSCANAYLITDGTHGINVSGNWSAGNTLHLCSNGGTLLYSALTNAITSPGSCGSVGNPVTLKWETGAQLSAPVWPGNPGGGQTGFVY